MLGDYDSGSPCHLPEFCNGWVPDLYIRQWCMSEGVEQLLLCIMPGWMDSTAQPTHWWTQLYRSMAHLPALICWNTARGGRVADPFPCLVWKRWSVCVCLCVRVCISIDAHFHFILINISFDTMTSKRLSVCLVSVYSRELSCFRFYNSCLSNLLPELCCVIMSARRKVYWEGTYQK